MSEILHLLDVQSFPAFGLAARERVVAPKGTSILAIGARSEFDRCRVYGPDIPAGSVEVSRLRPAFIRCRADARFTVEPVRTFGSEHFATGYADPPELGPGESPTTSLLAVLELEFYAGGGAALPTERVPACDYFECDLEAITTALTTPAAGNLTIPTWGRSELNFILRNLSANPLDFRLFTFQRTAAATVVEHQIYPTDGTAETLAASTSTDLVLTDTRIPYVRFRALSSVGAAADGLAVSWELWD